MLMKNGRKENKEKKSKEKESLCSGATTQFWWDMPQLGGSKRKREREREEENDKRNTTATKKKSCRARETTQKVYLKRPMLQPAL